MARLAIQVPLTAFKIRIPAQTQLKVEVRHTRFCVVTGRVPLACALVAPLQRWRTHGCVSPARVLDVVQMKDEVPSVINTGESIRVQLTLECMQPFQDSPQLQVSFLSVPGTGHAYPLRLPVTVANFVEDVSMPPADFEARWGSLAGEVRTTLSSRNAAHDSADTSSRCVGGPVLTSRFACPPTCLWVGCVSPCSRVDAAASICAWTGARH